MKNITAYLEKELKEVEIHFDYYDSSDSTRRLIQSEKRQLERLIKVVKSLQNKMPSHRIQNRLLQKESTKLK